MTIFRNYSKYYDLLYSDKDYEGESSFIKNILCENGVVGEKLLNLGSGTGTHDFFLTKMGFEVLGVDSSKSMLEIAKKKYPERAASFIRGDAKNIRLNQTFSAVISLFNVINYMITDEDISKFFITCNKHLQRDGILIFDTWYGPAVTSLKPSVRKKELENDNFKIFRVANPKHWPDFCRVDINFEIVVVNKDNGKTFSFSEMHNIRYFFMPEIEKALVKSGFSFVEIIPWMSPNRSVDETSWNVTFVAKKVT